MSTSGEQVIHHREADYHGTLKEPVKQTTLQDSESSDEDEEDVERIVPELFGNEEQQFNWITASYHRFKEFVIASKGHMTKRVFKHFKK